METQLALFGRGTAPGCDPTLAGMRHHGGDDGTWVDHVPAWVNGHQELFDALVQQTDWQAGGAPAAGLHATVPDHGPGHPLLSDLSHILTLRYGRCLPRVQLRLYRHGRDHCPGMRSHRSVSPAASSLTALLGLGTPRTVRVRRRRGLGPLSFRLGWGDLLVVGGPATAGWTLETPASTRCHGAQLGVFFLEEENRTSPALAAR